MAATSQSSPLPLIIIGLALMILVVTTTLVVRRQGTENKWASDESLDDFEQLTSDSIAQAEASLLSMATTPPRPDGWTEEAFVAWLEGEKPEDWSDEQWENIRLEHASRLAPRDNETDEILF